MTKLYTSLARIYHEMYQSLFNYKEDFSNYHKLLQKYKCNTILELGCGSGNLSLFFVNAGYNYLGIDISKEMLAIAQKTAPDAEFRQGDMRSLQLKERFDAILITGRSFTYMTKNKDVMDTLRTLHTHLNDNGYLIFDNFNAEIIFTDFKNKLVQTAQYNDKHFKRVSSNSMNLKTGWTWNWKSTYYVTENGETKDVDDSSVLRAFTEDELKLFLTINGFSVLEIMKEDAAITIVAQKKVE